MKNNESQVDLTRKKPVIKNSEENRKTLKWQRDRDHEKVKGIFRFYEVPGGSMEFVFKKYPNDPVENYTMYDGQVYEIPRMVAEHLNKNGWYPEYAHAPGEPDVQLASGVRGGFKQDANYVQVVGRKVHRFGFQSLEFVDIGDGDQFGKF